MAKNQARKQGPRPAKRRGDLTTSQALAKELERVENDLASVLARVKLEVFDGGSARVIDNKQCLKIQVAPYPWMHDLETAWWRIHTIRWWLRRKV